MSKKRDDTELVLAAKGGDESSFCELFNKYKSFLLFKLTPIVGSVDAEDVLMISFSKAFININKYEPTFSFSSWLYRISVNTAYDFLRRKKTRIQESDLVDIIDTYDDVLMAPSSNILNPEDILIKKQNHIQLRKLVSQLPKNVKSTVELRYFEGKDYSEIAEELKMPMNTVKNNLFRAKGILYKKLIT